ncbi:hypothetical protein M3148_16815 [Georgenia satyanarayanai]|uniref:hypothetical protein n=1 Tax=Georgenia satyanarayanai TaxID=860221 RepID=UPI00203A4433|nr:hypothetical protein [Georgenia satyanarayanai]MCM3662636.1 hypothetical protein [Georgenia satyanarayanai]
MFATIAVSVTAIDPQLPYTGYAGNMAFLGVVLWMLVSVVTMRISVDHTTMVIINGISVVKFRRDDILDVSSHNGITIDTRSGYRCTSGAYGSSNFQGFRPSARYERIASKIRTWASLSGAGRDDVAVRQIAGAAHHKRQPSRRAVSRPPWRPRRMLTVGLPVSLLMTQLLGLVLWAASERLYTLLGHVGF